jgi:PAS domain S-box-containing protein
MLSLSILGLSIILLFCAAATAIRLIFLTKKVPAWLFIPGAIVLIGIHRSITFYHAAFNEQHSPIHLATELIALFISLSLLVGMLIISRTFRQLGRSDLEYRHLIESMIDVYYVTDAIGKIEVISDSCMLLLGYSAAESKGLLMSSFYAEADGRERFMQEISVNGGSIQGFQAALKHKNGQSVLVETNAKYRYDASGNILGIEGIARDITDRVNKDHMNSQLGRIVEDAIHEIYLFDSKTFNFTLVNRGARENLGYSLDELLKIKPWELESTILEYEFKGLIAPLVSGDKRTINFETTHIRKNGTRYPVEVLIQYISSEVRPLFFADIQDLTIRKKVQAELVQSQRLHSVGQLTGGVAHDFNNLLLALQLNVEQMSDPVNSAEQYQASALKIINRASQLTQRLLAFSRQQVLQPKKININDTLTSIEDILQRSLGGAIDLKFELSNNLKLSDVDEAQLENVILNLVLNAKDSMPEGGLLRIISQNTTLSIDDGHRFDELTPGSYVEVKVVDSGRGMSPEILKLVFEPFFTTKGVGEGTGLGLSMVYGFLKQTGGHVHIESTPESGTLVRMFFPESPESAVVEKAVQEETETSIKTGNETLLLIEDEEIVREITASTLVSLGYSVLTAVDGADAFRKAGRVNQKIDLIISDIMLAGGISGPQAVAQIIKTVGPTRTIFISGYSLEASTEYTGSIGKHAFIQKPFTIHKLAEQIRYVLQNDLVS